MLKWLIQRSATSVGIDIGANSVSLLKLCRIRTGYEILSYTHRDDNNIAALLKQTKIKSTIIGMPHAAVISKVIQLDASLHTDEIENYLLMNMRKYTGFAAQDIRMDFNVLGLAPNFPNKVAVQLIAARREQVAARTKLLGEANIKVEAVDVESFALQRAALLQVAQADDVVAIVNLRQNSLLLCITQGNSMLYVKEEQIVALPDIAQQINQELQLFFANHSVTITQIIVAGTYADQMRLINNIAAATNITTYIANPFMDMECAGQIDKKALHKTAHTMLLSCGLALWKFAHD